MPRQWKCTVCGYLYEGPGPPDICPLCGADSAEFIPLEKEKFNLLHDLWQTLVVHAVASHFPNGLVPVAALFFLLAAVTGNPHFEPAAFYLVVLTLAVVPVSLVSGIYDWRTRFAATPALIFYKKIGLALVLFALSAATVALRCSHPDPAMAGGLVPIFYGALLLGMLGCVILLGHYGGKLAFKWKDNKL